MTNLSAMNDIAFVLVAYIPEGEEVEALLERQAFLDFFRQQGDLSVARSGSLGLSRL